MTQKPKRQVTPALPSAISLDHSNLLRLLGYHLHCADARCTQQFRKRVTPRYQINPSEFAILCQLEINANVNPTLLSEELGMAPPNLAVTLAGLHTRKLIARIPNQLDRRSTHLELTPAGRTLLRKVRDIVTAGEAELLSSLSAAQKETLFSLLTQIHKIGMPS